MTLQEMWEQSYLHRLSDGELDALKAAIETEQKKRIDDAISKSFAFPLDESTMIEVIDSEWRGIEELRKRLSQCYHIHIDSFHWSTVAKCLYNLRVEGFIEWNDNALYRITDKATQICMMCEDTFIGYVKEKYTGICGTCISLEQTPDSDQISL